MKQYTISLDEYTNSLLEQTAEQAQMNTPDFIRHTVLLYLARQQEDSCSVKSTSVCPKNAAASAQNDIVFRQFIVFLNEKLRDCSQTYIRSYQICPESYVDWAEPALYTGDSSADSCALQKLCGRSLEEAIANGNEVLCFEAVRLAMDWGKTYYNHRFGVLKGNEAIVCALHERGELLGLIRRSRQAILNGRITDLEYFTTGWSIIWHIIDPDRLVIMGPREIYAYNKILAEFKQLYSIGTLPASLGLGQLVYKKNRRYIAGVQYVYTLKGKLRMLERLQRILKAVMAMGDVCSMAGIGEKLFMLGE